MRFEPMLTVWRAASVGAVLWMILAGSAACSAPPEPIPAEGAYEHAVERALAGRDDRALAALRVALDADRAACQRALLEPAFHEGLRDTRGFRIAVHEAAVQHGIARLVLVGKEEPGDRIEVVARVVDPDGRHVEGAIVHVFATDEKGRYHPVIEGERTSRIFGTMVTDETGRVRFETVRPGPYPGTRNPRHIHVQVRHGERRLSVPHYAVFDDDPLLFEAGNEEPRREAVRIAMREAGADGIARGELELPIR